MEHNRWWHGTDLNKIDKIFEDKQLRPQMFYQNQWSPHPTGKVLFCRDKISGILHDVAFGIPQRYVSNRGGTDTQGNREWYIYLPIPIVECCVKVWGDLLLFWYQGPDGPALQNYLDAAPAHLHTVMRERIFKSVKNPAAKEWIEQQDPF